MVYPCPFQNYSGKVFSTKYLNTLFKEMEIFFFLVGEVPTIIKAAFLEILRLNQTPKAIPGNFVGIFKLGGQTASMQICVLGHIFKAILRVQTGEENFQEYPRRVPKQTPSSN